jgi:hypothetical protein
MFKMWLIQSLIKRSTSLPDINNAHDENDSAVRISKEISNP